MTKYLPCAGDMYRQTQSFCPRPGGGCILSGTGKITVPPPRPPEIPPHKTADPEKPVNHHSHPYSYSPHSHKNAEYKAETDTECDHGKNSCHHGIFYIIAGAEHIGQHKGRWPEQHCRAVMNHHQSICQPCSLVPQAVKTQNRMQKQQNKAVYHRRGSIGSIILAFYFSLSHENPLFHNPKQTILQQFIYKRN